MRVRVIALAAFAVLAAAAPARAAVYTVTATADPGTCDGFSCTGLQAALDAAKGTKGADEVDLRKATYTASKGLTMSDSQGVTVVGLSARGTVLNGTTGVRTLSNSGIATLQHVKVTGGSVGDANGGGILNSGTLTLDHVEVSGNQATSGGNGGGIASTGTLTILNSLITGNTAAGAGGGLFLTGVVGGTATKLTMRDSTVAFNTAQIRSGGGGIDMRGNAANAATLQRVTVAGNTGGNPDLGAGGILVAGDGEVLAASATIVSGNKNVTGTASNCLGQPRDDGFNLESGTDCAFKSGLQNANPGFPSGLVDGGGETDVLPIPSTSPAVDLGPACSGVADQRDVLRPQGKACDAGAYELDQAPDMIIDDGPPKLTRSSTVQFTFHSSEPGVTFQCSTDGTSFKACSSPASFTLADGTYTFTVQASDGTHAAVPSSATFTIDSTAPASPVFTAPANNAALNTHDVTLRGTAEAGASVRIQEGQPVDTTVTASGTGAWSAPLTVAEGTHTYTAFATDAAGNVSPASATRTITVDTIAPAAPTITTPAGDITQNTTTVSLSGGTEPGATVVVFEGASPRRSATANGQGLWSASFTAPDGAHTYTATATDAAGNVSPSSSSRTVTVDTVAPNTTLTPVASPSNDTTPTFAFTSSEAGSTFKCLIDDGALASCTSPYTPPALTDGTHTFSVFATDAAGNADPTPAKQTFTINTQAPTVTFLAAPTAPTNDSTPTFTFASSDPGSSFSCRFDGDDFAGCASPFTPETPLSEGEHTFDVQARDALGNVGSASRLVVIDLTPPSPPTVQSGPSGVTSDASPSFTFAPSDGATVECSLAGPGHPGAFAPCASPASFSGLAPGDYLFTVRARDAAGNTTTSSRAFTVAVPQQGPTPTPTPTPSPTPAANQSVVVQPAGGKVLVRRKGTNTFVALDATEGIPLGSEVDTRHGRVELSSVPKPGAQPQTSLFYGGLFVVTQSKGVTQLALSERLAACPRGRAASAAAKKKKPKTRNLWGDGHGSFRTKGRYSAATVRGTKWNVQDSCAGTLTRVVRGVVSVRDDVRHRTITLRAGKKYLARPPRRR